MYSDQHKHFQMICSEIALLYRIYIYIIIMLVRMTLDSSSLPGRVKERLAYTLYSITTLVVITTNNFSTHNSCII